MTSDSTTTEYRTETILIVEDESLIAMDLQQTLRGFGYNVLEPISSGKEAVERATKNTPDLVLMDIQLEGEMDGIQAAKLLHRSSSVPVIFLTAFSTPEMIQRAKDVQPYGYVLKPFDERNLSITIEMALHRKRLEDQLHQRDRLVDATFSSIDDGVVVVDPETTITAINPAALRLFRTNEAEVLGRPCDSLTAPHRRHGSCPLQSLVREALDENETRHSKRPLRFGRFERESLTLEATASPLLGTPGEQLGAVLTLRDVTERLEAARTSSTLAAIVSGCSDAILAADLDGKITNWNESAERLYGYTSEEAVGRGVALLGPNAGFLQRIDAVRAGEVLEGYDSIHLHQDGQELDVHVSISALRVEGPEPVGFAAIIRDMTAHRELEQKRRHAQKMEAVGRLASGVAHDFNNLLTIINGYTNLILDSELESESSRSMLDQVSKAGERAVSLANRLLSICSTRVMVPKFVDLDELIDEVLAEVLPELDTYVHVERIRTASLPSVSIDPEATREALGQLVQNALEALSMGGTLTASTGVRLSQDELGTREVFIAIEDTGKGMNRAALERVFDPFYTTKRDKQGAGLGLAVAKSLVEQMGGRIELTSKPQQGTRCEIVFPVSADSLGSLVPVEQSRTPSTTRGTILFVEDDRSVRTFGALVLRENGFSVLEAESGEEALTIVAESTDAIDLLVTDIFLNTISGPLLGRTLTRSHPDLRVLYQSAYPPDELQHFGISFDDSNFLGKPYSARALVESVDQILVCRTE